MPKTTKQTVLKSIKIAKKMAQKRYLYRESKIPLKVWNKLLYDKKFVMLQNIRRKKYGLPFLKLKVRKRKY